MLRKMTLSSHFASQLNVPDHFNQCHSRITVSKIYIVEIKKGCFNESSLFYTNEMKLYRGLAQKLCREAARVQCTCTCQKSDAMQIEFVVPKSLWGYGICGMHDHHYLRFDVRDFEKIYDKKRLKFKKKIVNKKVVNLASFFVSPHFTGNAVIDSSP